MSSLGLAGRANLAAASFCIAAANLGCSDGIRPSARGMTALTPGPVLTTSSFDRPWVRLAVPLDANDSLMSVSADDGGFAALVRNAVWQGDGLVSASHRLAVTRDGKSWSSHTLDDMPPTWLNDVAYGRGRYVIAGGNGFPGTLRTSTDGVTWARVDAQAGGPLGGVSFVNDRFFAMGVLGSLLVSDDGILWTEHPQKDAELYAVTYGMGTYVLGGTGNLWVSTDTATWEPIDFPCAMREACIGATAPDWKPGQAGSFEFRDLVFDGQRFWAGRYVSSDGHHWQVLPAGQAPTALVDGFLLRFDSDGSVWGSRDGTDWPLHTTLTDVVPPGASCNTGTRCFVASTPQAGLATTDKTIVLVPQP
jgi:hypothetical protein